MSNFAYFLNTLSRYKSTKITTKRFIPQSPPVDRRTYDPKLRWYIIGNHITLSIPQAIYAASSRASSHVRLLIPLLWNMMTSTDLNMIWWWRWLWWRWWWWWWWLWRNHSLWGWLVLSVLTDSIVVLCLPLELGLHEPLLALAELARSQQRRGRVVRRGPRQAVPTVDVLDSLLLEKTNAKEEET